MKAFGAVCLKVLDVIGRVCQFICSVIAMFMVLLVFLQVVLRAFNMPLFGIEELLTFPTIWLYFLGGVCASFTDAHIECGLIGAVCKNPKAVVASQCFANICASLLSVYVLQWVWQYAQYSLKINKVSAILGIPMPLGELVMFVGLVLMAVFTISKMIRNLIELKSKLTEGGAV